MRPTDGLVLLAGANRETLSKCRGERAYFVGMGMSLLLAATISTSSLMEATSIAFDTSILSAAVIVAGVIYFVLLLGVDRWLVSDPTVGFGTERTSAQSTVVAWIGHLFVEVLRIAPRLAIAVLSSWLFATFLMLAVFNPEIQQQLKKFEVQEQAQYTLSVQAQEASIIG